MGTGFVPLRDPDLLLWSTSFKSLITATPTLFGLTAALATQYGTKHDAYASALAVVQNATTKTKGAVAAKDAAKKALRTLAGQLGKTAQNFPSITAQQLDDLRVTVRSRPAPIPPPADAPQVVLSSVKDRTVSLLLRGPDANMRRKPAGVQGAIVFSFIGEAPPDDMSAWYYQGNTGKDSAVIEFPIDTPPFSKVWFTACWYNPRGENGPACTPISANLGAWQVQETGAGENSTLKAA
ncbi:MAG: hypothetical protein QM770_18580 [Tepidisphaeraceae bacterium]